MLLVGTDKAILKLKSKFTYLLDSFYLESTNSKHENVQTGVTSFISLKIYRVSHKKASIKNFYSELLKASIHSF